MNAIRIIISLFIVVLIVIAAMGWHWTAGHQAPTQAAASHVVLGLAMLAGIAGVALIWRPRRSG
jgi:hypothetical protein